MSRAVVHNPKDAASGPVGLLVHDFADEAIHRSNSSLYFTAAENLGPMDIPSCQVGPSALAKVLVLDANGTVGSGRQGWLFPAAGLTPASRLSLQAGHSGESKSLTPLADDLTRRVQLGCDDVVGQAFIGEKDDLGANHIAIR